jgi:hypothetical protein
LWNLARSIPAYKNPPPFAVLEAAEITHRRASPGRGNGNLASDLESGPGAVGAVLTESAGARRRACGDGSRGPAAIRSTPGPVALFLSMGAVLDLLHRRPRRRRLARVALVGARHLSFSPRLLGVGDCGGRGRRKGNAGRGGMFRGERSPRSAAKAFERPPNAQRTDDQALIWDRFGPYC